MLAVDHVDEHLQQGRPDPAAAGGTRRPAPAVVLVEGDQRRHHRAHPRAQASRSPRQLALAHHRVQVHAVVARARRPRREPEAGGDGADVAVRVGDRAAGRVAAPRLAVAARRPARRQRLRVVVVELERLAWCRAGRRGRCHAPARRRRRGGRPGACPRSPRTPSRSAWPRSPCVTDRRDHRLGDAPGVERRRALVRQQLERMRPAPDGRAVAPPGRIRAVGARRPAAPSPSSIAGATVVPAPSSAAGRTTTPCSAWLRARAQRRRARAAVPIARAAPRHPRAPLAPRPSPAPTAYGTSWPPKSIAISCGGTAPGRPSPGTATKKSRQVVSPRRRVVVASRTLRRRAR